jgi:hypothetical protein
MGMFNITSKIFAVLNRYLKCISSTDIDSSGRSNGMERTKL